MQINFDSIKQANHLVRKVHQATRKHLKVKEALVHHAVAKACGYKNYTDLKIAQNQGGTPTLLALDIHQLNDLIAKINFEIISALSSNNTATVLNNPMVGSIEQAVQAFWQNGQDNGQRGEQPETLNLNNLLDRSSYMLTQRARCQGDTETILLVVQNDNKVHLEKLKFSPGQPKESYFGFVRALLDITQAKAYAISGLAYLASEAGEAGEEKSARKPCLYVSAATPKQTLLWQAEIRLANGRIESIGHGHTAADGAGANGGIDNLFKARYQVTGPFRDEIRSYYQERRRQLVANGAGAVDYREFVWG